MRSAAHFLHLLHQVLRPARAVAAGSVPQADEIDLFGAVPRGHLQHPLIVAFERISVSLERAKFFGRDVECGL
jgi:hypothetical protein